MSLSGVRTLITLFSLFLQQASIAAFGLRLDTLISCFCFWCGVISVHHMIPLAFPHSSRCLCVMILEITSPCLLPH
jgi:hypothetical protein